MTDDIVTQLRESEWNENPQTNVRLCAEAADEIERLRAKLIAAFDDIGRCHAIIDQLEKDNPT